MKVQKVITLILFVLCIVSLQAQTTKNDSTCKKHADYLPKAGELGIGVDATPIFNYLGNLLSSAGNNTLNLSSPVVYLKYYLTDNSALRGILSVSSIDQKDLSYVRDDAAYILNPLSNKQLTDLKNTSNQQYSMSLAYQRYTGKSRLRGFYGGQLIGGYTYSTTTYTYGNTMSVVNPRPSTIASYGFDSSRPLKSINTNSMFIGGGGIAGFEYYVLPKLCIGGEVSLNIIYTKGSQLSNTTEKVVGDGVVKSDQATSPGSSQLSIKTSRFNPNGFVEQIGFYVMFHF